MSDDGHPKSSLTAWERWELASFDPAPPAEAPPAAAPPSEAAPEAPPPEPPPPPPVSAEEIERIIEQARREGHEQGYAAGHAEGLAAGEAAAAEAGRQEVARFTALIERLDEQIGALDQAVADELLALALEIARQVTRQALAAKPELILGVIREALAQLPVQHAAIYLHPEDAARVRARAGEQIAHAGHRLHEDPKLAPGDVVIEAGGSHVDATVATRWRRTLAALGQDSPWIVVDTPPAP